MKKTLTSVLLTLMLIGCGGVNNVSLKESVAELTTQHNHAYITFVSPDVVFAPAVEVFEFNPKTFEPKYIGTIQGGEKYVHATNAGNHYYYLNPILSSLTMTLGKKFDKTIVIDAHVGKNIYLNNLIGEFVNESQTKVDRISSLAGRLSMKDIAKFDNVRPTLEARQLSNGNLRDYQVRIHKNLFPYKYKQHQTSDQSSDSDMDGILEGLNGLNSQLNSMNNQMQINNARTMEFIQNNNNSLLKSGCTSDFSCGVGYKCVKAQFNSKGTCMKSIDSHGIQQFNSPVNNVGPNMNGQCTFNTDCPIGFSCKSGNCVK